MEVHAGPRRQRPPLCRHRNHVRAQIRPIAALHKKSWAVIDRPYSLGLATVGALYERPRYISCAKPPIALSSGGQLPICNPEAKTFEVGFELCALGVFPDNNR